MAVSASTRTAIENFIKEVEEGPHPTIGEVPDPHNSQSGVTIAAGFDLGTQNLHDLHQLNLPQDLIDRLTPYLGLRGEDALHFLNAHPLTISQDERQLINHALTERLVQRVESRYNHDSVIPFAAIPQAAQVIIASVVHQYGDLQNRAPNFWNDVISQNWGQAISELLNFGDRYQSRHNKEAEYLLENTLMSDLAPDEAEPTPPPSDERTLDQLLGQEDPPMTQKELNDLLDAAPSQRSDAEVQAEKQQGMDALMKEIGVNESKQSFRSPETLQGRLADGNLNYTPASVTSTELQQGSQQVEGMPSSQPDRKLNLWEAEAALAHVGLGPREDSGYDATPNNNKGENLNAPDAHSYDSGSSNAGGYDSGRSDAAGYAGGYSDAGGYDAGSGNAGGGSDGDGDAA